MNTDEGPTGEGTAEPAAPVGDDRPAGAGAGDGAGAGGSSRGWWHRDHPVFSALSGFFAGLATVILVPGAFAAILNAMFTYERAEDIFPFVLLIFVIPAVLIAVPRTRRFGKYMLLGMVLTAVVVLGVAALVLWVLYRSDG